MRSRTTHQQDLMGLDYHLKIQGDMMADLNEGVPLQKAAQVMLDNLGQVKSHSNFSNHPGRLDHLRNRLEMQKSLGMVAEIERNLVEKSMSVKKVLLQYSRSNCCSSCFSSLFGWEEHAGGESIAPANSCQSNYYVEGEEHG